MKNKSDTKLLVEKYGEVFPSKLGACADLLWTLNKERKALQKKADALEAREVKLRQYIIDTLPKSEATGVAGKKGKVTIQTKEQLQGEDWDLFYKYVLKTKNPALLQRRFSELVSEMLEAGTPVPGVKIFRYKVVSLTNA